MSTDLRAALLARCDELEQIARAAGGDSWSIPMFDPAAVLELVAGAREMCEVHQPKVDTLILGITGVRREDCATCCTPKVWRDGQQWGGDPERYPCPTLRSTARMLGVAVAGG